MNAQGNQSRSAEGLALWIVGLMMVAAFVLAYGFAMHMQADIERLQQTESQNAERLARIESRLDSYTEIVRSIDRRLGSLEQARSVPK